MDTVNPAPLGPNQTRSAYLRQVLGWGISATMFLAAALVLTVILTQSVGVAGVLLGALVSSTVLGIVVPVFLWVDRLEAEPARWLWFAFLWGALVATSLSVVASAGAVTFVAALGFDTELVAAVLVAPVVEEFAKAAGVVAIFVVARREFNGVVDGITYAGLVGIGFAFVEDILYLGQSYTLLGEPGLVSMFILRCLFSPFAHPMFTVCFGIALGLIAHRRQWRYAALPLGGYLLAVAVHAGWNSAAVGDSWVAVYVLVQVPLFAGFVAVILWARRQEARTIRGHLRAYGAAGWFTPDEVSMLASAGQRRQARQWAKNTYGAAGEAAMRAFQDESAELAIAREHLQRGDTEHWWGPRAQRLLSVSAQHRSVLTALPRV